MPLKPVSYRNQNQLSVFACTVCNHFVEEKRDSDGIPCPAVTVAAWTQNGPKHCYHLNQSIEKCVEENSLNSSDLVKGILLGFEVRSSLNLTEDMLTEDFPAYMVLNFYKVIKNWNTKSELSLSNKTKCKSCLVLYYKLLSLGSFWCPKTVY